MNSETYIFGSASLLLFLLPVLGGLNGCATDNLTTLERDIKSYTERCTEVHGYDPEDVSGLGERELGPHEKEWRECLYEGIRTLIVPRSPVPHLYAEFIEQDRKMTEGIQKGAITRTHRKKKNQEFAVLIKQQEEIKRGLGGSSGKDELNETMRKKVELDMKTEFLEGPRDSFFRALGN